MQIINYQKWYTNNPICIILKYTNNTICILLKHTNNPICILLKHTNNPICIILKHNNNPILKHMLRSTTHWALTRIMVINSIYYVGLRKDIGYKTLQYNMQYIYKRTYTYTYNMIYIYIYIYIYRIVGELHNS